MTGTVITFTGKRVSPLSLSPEDVDIRDIARALAMTCRYRGHVVRYYSVAEHSVLVSQAVEATYGQHYPKQTAPTWLLRAALLHDATEAYLGDLASPIKPLMPEYRAIERRLASPIETAFRLHRLEPAIVRRVDARIVADEVRVLFPGVDFWRGHAADGVPERLGCVHVNGLSPERAERQFLERFEALSKDLAVGKWEDGQ